MTEFTDPQNLDPAQQERLAQWQAIDTEINRASEAMYGTPLDEGINDAAVGVNAVLGGFYTQMSCEGHDDHGNGSPWVGFNLSARGESVHVAQLDGMIRLVEEFNATRTTEPAMRLGIYTDMGGDRSGEYEITTVAGVTAAKSEDFEVGQKSAAVIEAEQQEFQDFAAFLKQKFINGFTIAVPEISATPVGGSDYDAALEDDIIASQLFAERSDLLADFAERPTENDVWESAYQLVREEGDGVDSDEELLTAQDIPAEDLIAFAEKVRNTPAAERYSLTAEIAPNGRPWFDVLSTFSSPQVERAKLMALQSMRRHFLNALDVGTGSGKSLATLEAVAEKVVGLDRNKDLLHVAEDKKTPMTDLVYGSVDHLPFDANTFDIIASSGLEHALNSEAATSFYKELARVLTPGGIYVDGSYYPSDDGYEGREMNDIKQSSKAMLADMIVDTVSGKLQIHDRLDADTKAALFAEAGLGEQYFLVEDPVYADGTMTVLRVITKL